MLKKISIMSFVVLSLGLAACEPPSGTISPSNGQSQTDNITIQGVVNDPSDKPMANVAITIKENAKVLGQTTTNDKGEFSMSVPKVFGDSYFIEAKKTMTDGDLTQTLLITSNEKANFTGANKLVKTQLAANPNPIQ